VRRIDERAIKAHADLRFRSEYDYALFEYYRAAKVIAFLERAGVAVRGRVLDAGCGGGGMPLSLAEEAQSAVGIDPVERF
jgi:2-polyprenyl-3-methyl-5-hydroxy-6-metoxy-1,4-benzoquinol methylase